MKYKFIHEHRRVFHVSVMCRVLEVATSGFYASMVRPVSKRAKRSAEIAKEVVAVHQEFRSIYGSIKIHKELLKRGRKVNRKTVAKFMKRANIRSKVCKKFRVCTTDSKHANPIAPNLLDRQFEVKEINKIWGTDITYIHTAQGVLYLAGIMDLCSRRIVGWSMDSTMTADLVINAMNMAVAARRPGPGLMHHSDRGVQYTCHRYRELLSMHGVTVSMSRKGNCYDNAVVESFWGKLKNEMVYHRKFTTRDQARAAIFDYIEVFYNRQRLHAAIGYVSPEAFEASRSL